MSHFRRHNELCENALELVLLDYSVNSVNRLLMSITDADSGQMDTVLVLLTRVLMFI